MMRVEPTHADPEIVAVALIGPHIADCRACFDAPRRFATPGARDAWADDHYRVTRHRIGVADVRRKRKVSA